MPPAELITRHVGRRELAYAFVSVRQLVEDFIAAVDAVREK